MINNLIKNLFCSNKLSYCMKINFRNNATTIFALASGLNQRCGIAVVRLSGKKASEILLKLTNKKNINQYETRKMYLRNIWHPVTQNKIDKGLVVLFKEPNSFTGEDLCEFHIHGGPAVISSLLNALSTFEDCRYAEVGEFSKRAFLNGRMDLTEAEGLLDLINAETEMQQKQALQQMEGSLSKLYKNWRENLIKCLANVEAYIDFSEEENVEENVLHEVEVKVKEMIHSIENHLNDNRKGERLRNGVRIAIIGKPNAGKSSLLNSLIKRPAAIVSPIPGTTRDIIESSINFSGYPVVISDTAGLRDTNDLVELEGVKRAIENIDSADILIILIDLNENYDRIMQLGVYDFLKIHLMELNISGNSNKNIFEWVANKNVIISLNKKDLIDFNKVTKLNQKLKFFEKNFDKIFINKISCLENNAGINDLSDLSDQLKNRIENLCSNTMNEMPSLTSARHRDNLEKCLKCLKKYLDRKNILINNDEEDYAIYAEELRLSIKWLGSITGHVTTDNVLDVIFKDFCIGK